MKKTFMCVVASVLMLLVAGCSEGPKSAVGESCEKTSDCEEGAKCIDQTCVSGDSAKKPEENAEKPAKEPAEDGKAKEEKPKFDGCEAAKKLAGFWGWTSTVVGSHGAKAIGVNGYYQLTIKEKDCKLTATMDKTGFSRHTWKSAKIQKGSAELKLSAVPGFAGMASGTFNLVSDSGSSAEIAIHVVPDNDLLWGYWSYEGKKWEEGGMWGAVRGKRDSTDRLKFKTWSDQPCAIQCTLGCEMPRRQKEHDVAGSPIEACIASCEGKPRATPTLCKARKTQLAPEDVSFKDKKKGWGWSNRCYKHYKEDRLAYAEAACREGIKVAKKLVDIPRLDERDFEEPSGDSKAMQALSALYYNLGLALEKRGAKKLALAEYVRAAYFSNGSSKGALKKLKELGYKSICDEPAERAPCRALDYCCYQ